MGLRDDGHFMIAATTEAKRAPLFFAEILDSTHPKKGQMRLELATVAVSNQSPWAGAESCTLYE